MTILPKFPTKRFAQACALLPLLVSPMAASAAGYFVDRVGPEAIPGGGVPGVVVVDDADASVQRDPVGERIVLDEGQIEKHTPVFQNTLTQVNAFGAVGDGQTRLKIAPQLEPGAYQVWVRFAYLKNDYYGMSDSARLQLDTARGTEELKFSPKQTFGNWLFLGTHDLPGKGPVLQMDNQGTNGMLAFDAAVFVPVKRPIPSPPARYLPKAGDELQDIVRKAAEGELFPADADPSNPLIASRMRQVDFEARLNWDTMIRGADRPFNWFDHCQSGRSWNLTAAAERIRSMAVAWAGATEIDHIGMRGNPQLLADILEAMNVFLTKEWTPETTWGPNWFDFEIAVPKALFGALCVLGDNVPPDILEKAVASLNHFNAKPNLLYGNAFEGSGTNLAWNLAIHVRKNALTRNADGITHCREFVPRLLSWVDENPDVVPSVGEQGNRDGFWKDGAFVYHGNMPYIGAYGGLLVPPLVELVRFFQGTEWAFTPQELAIVQDWVDLAYLPVMTEGEVFPRTTGRTAGAIGIETSSQWIVIGLSELRPILSAEKAAEVSSRLKRWKEKGGFDPKLERANPLEFARLMETVNNPKMTAAGPYEASRSHAATDMAVHHRPQWAASLAMSSTRTFSFESIWGANVRGWKQGDGVLMVYPSDPTRYRHGFWALVDPYRLPGITTSTWQLADQDHGGGASGTVSQQHFVGGASLDDLVTVATMAVGRTPSTLTARKGWFFLPDAIVCLGTDIRSQDGTPVETIVENTPLRSLEQPVLVNGKALPAGEVEQSFTDLKTLLVQGEKPEQNVGFLFPTPSAGLRVIRNTRSGSWKDVHPTEGPADTISSPWLSVIQDHGVDPTDASYAYIIYPGITEAALAQQAREPKIRIVTSTPQIQAVRDEANQILGVIFYEAGEVEKIKASAPCVVVIRQSKDGTSLAVSDPSQQLESLTLDLGWAPTGKVNAGEGVQVTTRPGGVQLVIDLNNSFGYERTVHWGGR